MAKMDAMERHKILVIDDDPIIRNLLVELLKEHYCPLSAENGSEGLSILGSNQIALTLLDIKLNGMDGIEVLRQIRGKPSDVPVLMMTGYSHHDMAVECANIGIQGYILKPFKPVELKQKIDSTIRPERREVFRKTEYKELAKAVTSNDHIVKSALNVIHSRYKDPNLSRRFIADVLGISEEYLSKKFDNECGLSLPEYITGLRLIDAERLLRESEHKISKIAAFVGFSSLNYFSTVFKKRHNTTPLQYRIEKKALSFVNETVHKF